MATASWALLKCYTPGIWKKFLRQRIASRSVGDDRIFGRPLSLQRLASGLKRKTLEFTSKSATGGGMCFKSVAGIYSGVACSLDTKASHFTENIWTALRLTPYKLGK